MRRAVAGNLSSLASAQRVVRSLSLLGIGVAVGILALGLAILFDARNDAWRQAELASQNLVLALEQDIARDVRVYDLSIQSVSQAMELPGINQVSPEFAKWRCSIAPPPPNT